MLVLKGHKLHDFAATCCQTARGRDDAGDESELPLSRWKFGRAHTARPQGFLPQHMHRMIGEVHAQEVQLISDPHQRGVQVAPATERLLWDEALERAHAPILL